MKYSLDDMAIFAAVAEHGSFSKAAKATNIPVSTISRRIIALENRLNVQLLVRTTRQQSLTDVGVEYAEHCARMLENAKQAELAVLNLQAEPSGLLRLTMPYAYEDRFMSDLISSFIAKYPKVQLEHIVSTRKVDLIEEKIDCAIFPGEMQDSSLIRRGLGSTRFIYCASPDYLERKGTPVKIDDLKGHDFIEMTFADWLILPQDPLKHHMQCRYKTNDMFSARRAAVDGLGITGLPLLHVQHHLVSGDLIQILPDINHTVPVNLVFPGNKQYTTKLRAFIDHMVEFACEHATWEFN